jgi:hypothetical protein
MGNAILSLLLRTGPASLDTSCITALPRIAVCSRRAPWPFLTLKSPNLTPYIAMEDINEKPLRESDTKSPGSTSDSPSIQDANDSKVYKIADEGKIYTRDEYHLATLGYKQEFLRSLSLFENWAATFTSMNFISGIPVLFGFVMYTGGPKAAFANWTMVGGLSCIVSLVLAEVCRADALSNPSFSTQKVH